ncbi:MAG TPA: PIG-L deacetylase family protein [Blastocatellia bacterium]|nr:PIG-L deacetylase family protein [Blastocatellia bacterium]
MIERPTLLAVFAHPDDETIAAGGTLARYAAAGVRVALLCATRGEWGPISDDALADYETLGQVREQELRAACEVLGIRWLQFLDLPDGGVDWAMEDESYGALEKVVRAMRELRPQVVITFGPDGMYGHDDHIAIGRLTTEAFAMAGQAQTLPEQNLRPHQPRKLYYSALPKTQMPALVERLAAAGKPANLWDIPSEQFGIAPESITTSIDVSEFLSHKLQALHCHRTQMMEDHAFAHLSLELAREVWREEGFRLVNGTAANLTETDLFAGLGWQAENQSGLPAFDSSLLSASLQ